MKSDLHKADIPSLNVTLPGRLTGLGQSTKLIVFHSMACLGCLPTRPLKGGEQRGKLRYFRCKQDACINWDYKHLHDILFTYQ